jgi:murein DD-endopeptidase MepM/ murein hydrolase activator NlpD
MSTNEPTGIRNKNYLNIKNGGSPWMDAGGRESGTDERGHAVFKDSAYGIRAGILQLRAYFFKHNLRTIAEILSRWAPASDTVGSLPGAPMNSPAEYSAFVAKRMGVGYNQKLDIFKEDMSVGNIARLRDLFFAMAAYEIGHDFQAPEDEFTAGLELVQQGITSAGTGTSAGGGTNNAGDNDDSTNELDLNIGGSVGRADKNPVNAKEDVETVQEMLRQASLILHEPALDPGTIDGLIGKDAANSDTVKAIEAFQSRFLAKPDGVIDVGGRTWRELVNALEHGEEPEDSEPVAVDKPKYYFPFTRLPDENWTEGMRRYGASRKGGRAHAACDLYFPVGTIIHAIGDGTVIQGSTPFYEGTNYIVIDHGDFVARYGEVQPTTLVHEGDRVKAGQPVAKVGRLKGMTLSMLHLELYNKTAHGPLSVPREKGGKINGRPTLRRKDLIDPTPKLNEWRHNLAGSHAPAHESAAAFTGGIPSEGFCIHLKRVRQEKRASLDHARTVGEYQCYWNGVALEELKGQMVERGGPGDNTTEVGNNRDLRVRSGSYRLAIHSGSHYRTYGYNEQDAAYSKHPNPGLLLMDTDERSWILIHPGEDYVKSIGCLNPASGLADADSVFAFADSRGRVVAIIETMKSKLGSRFPKSGAIPDAVIFIEGEPV